MASGIQTSSWGKGLGRWITPPGIQALMAVLLHSEKRRLAQSYDCAMRIEALTKYQRRNQNGRFDDLPFHLRGYARGWLERFVRRRRASGKPFPPWLFANYCGQAKRLARNPPTSAWGRSMLAKRGGHAVQQKYRWEGRHPTAKATRVKGRKAEG
jgi:hypothetical protein